MRKNLLYLTTKMFGWIMLLVSLMAFEEAKAQTDKTIDVKNIWSDSYYSENELIKGKSYNITFSNRSFAVNNWEFLALPFEASKTVLDNAFGEGNYELQEFDQLDGVTFKFKKMETPAMTTAKPYLIKILTTAVNNPTFNNIILNANSQADEVQLGNASTVILRSALWTYDGNTIINNNDSKPYYPLFEGSLVAAGWYGDGIRNLISVTGAYARSKDGTSVPTISIETSGGGSGSGGDDPVDPTSLSYKIANKLQLTNAPTIYITLPDIGDTSLDNYLYKKGGNSTKEAEAPYRRASIKVVATEDTTSPHYMESFEEDADHLQVKVRGNSTALQGVPDAKRAYRLKFAKKDKTTGKNFKHDMINGGYSKRNWALLANVFDHSMIRNALTCELGKIVGMPFNPGYKFVDLVINDQYRGTYQVTDHPEVDGDRINVNEDTGWYVEFQGRSDMCDFPMCFAEGGITMNIKNPEPAYTGTETTRADSAAVENVIINEVKDWFRNTWTKGFSTGYTNPNTGWRAYNDEETLLKWWIITEITGDYDGLMTVKAYREADGKLCWGPVWDKDLAYGNYSSMSDADGTLVKDLTANGSSVKNYFLDNFAKDPKFMASVKSKMDELVTAGLKTTLCNKIDDLAALVSQTEALNYTKWAYNRVQGGLEVYYGDVSGYDNYAAYITQLKNWINARVDYVQSEINTLYNATNPATPTAWTFDVTSNPWSETMNGHKDVLRNVTMTNRTLTANLWNAVSFPFDIDNTMMKSVFGDEFELKTFTGISEDGTSMLFTTPVDEAIAAGIPYLLKPSKAVDASPLFNGVIPSVNVGYYNNTLINGSTITFGNYTFAAHIFNNNLVVDGTVKLVGTDGTTLSTPEKVNTYDTKVAVDGCMAYIQILNSAEAPTITFPSDNPNVRTQLTNIPTIYIDTKDGAAINPSTGDYVSAAIEVMDANGTLTPFTETDEFLEIRGRGKAEWAVDGGKKSYRLKFAKKHKYDLTGAGYTKRNWVLAANAADESLIKNALTKKLGDQIGLPFTPNTCFVDLVVNGVYLGTYTAMDFVEADREDGVSRRVDADESTGWLLELVNEDGVDKTGDVYLSGTNFNSPWVVIKNPEPNYKKTDTDEVKNAAIEAVKTPVQTFISNLWTAPETYVDKSSLVNWYIASEILGGAQTLSSVYAYKDAEDSELKFGPLWGNELSWQNGSMADLNNDETKNGLIVNSATESAWRNKLQSLWSESWFKSAVVARWLEVKTGLADILKTQAETLKTTISSSWTKNYTAVASNGAGWTASGTLDSDVNTIKTYIDGRIAYLDKKFLLSASSVDYDVTRDDATTAYAGFNNRTVDVTLVNRGTITKDYWNPITLPFNATQSQMEAVFGTGYELEQFNGVETSGDQVSVLKFAKVEPKDVVAGEPYLIKPSADVSTLSFTDVTFNASEEKIVDVSGGYSFCGLLQKQVFNPDKTHLFVGKNNKFVRLGSSATLTGGRAYFTIPEEAYSKQFSYGQDDEIVTGLRTIAIEMDTTNTKIYNLNGQFIGTSLRMLPHGIYIVNGKKIVK